MKALHDPAGALTPGLDAIRAQFRVPAGFPPAVLQAAEAAAKRTPTEHVDRTAMRFVTLDPASSTDLDQAFAIEASGSDMLLHYAIADVGWFVEDRGILDDEAWTRGQTLYLPDGKASLYPPILSEGGASLLPNVDRPAVVFAVRIAPDGAARIDGVERAIIRSSAKLAYETVTSADLTQGFDEIARRINAAEDARGASRVDPPEQEVSRTEDGFTLAFRPRLQSEDDNAALSLATNLAVADLMLAHKTGLFRVMAPPNAQRIERLRRTAAALKIDWPASLALPDFETRLDAGKPAEASLMLAIRRAGEGAIYMPYTEGVRPWHSAMAATYAHSTAPLRRLADRYVVLAALALANGKALPAPVAQAFARLPAVMARTDNLSRQVEHAVIDLAEAVMLAGSVGQTFDAIVTDADDHGVRIQLCDMPVVARLNGVARAAGATLAVRLTATNPLQRTITFEALD